MYALIDFARHDAISGGLTTHSASRLIRILEKTVEPETRDKLRQSIDLISYKGPSLEVSLALESLYSEASIVLCGLGAVSVMAEFGYLEGIRVEGCDAEITVKAQELVARLSQPPASQCSCQWRQMEAELRVLAEIWDQTVGLFGYEPPEVSSFLHIVWLTIVLHQRTCQISGLGIWLCLRHYVKGG